MLPGRPLPDITSGGLTNKSCSPRNPMCSSIIIPVILLALLGAGLAPGTTQVEVKEVAVGGRIVKPGMYSFVPSESLAELLNRAGGIPMTLEDQKRYQAGEVVKHVRIVLYRDAKKHEYQIDPKSNTLWEQMIQKQDAVEVAKADPLYFGDFSATLRLRKPTKGEQAGTGQPATRPESKSEGSDKPQPEAEGRSR